MSKDKNFVNLHSHSCYSILEATAKPKEIAEKAKELGCPAVALTDSGAGYGLIEFYEQSQKVGDIKPIMGVEVSVAKDSRFEHRAGIDGREGHLVLLVKNDKGWENLLQIISKSYLDGFYYKARADWEILEAHSEGLIVLTGGTAGLVGKIYSQFGEGKSFEVFEKIQDVFGKENVFVELVARDYPEQVELNKFLVRLAKDKSADIIATSDSRYLEEDGYEAADTLYCIGKNLQVLDENRFKFAEKNWFKSWSEICGVLEFVGADELEYARKNTLRIAESIDFDLEFGQDLLPQFPGLNGKSEKSQLVNNCEKGYIERFGKKIKTNKVYQERLEYELGIISKMGFDAYFLIVQDFIDFAKENGISVGPGRGSAAGSLVSYLLGITNIDPIEYELLFERFLNPERVSMPDIDIDFSDERREEVMQYVIEKYGAEKVSKVCTFGTLAAKAALKDVGRARGVPYAEMNAMTKVLPTVPGFKLADAEKTPDFKTLIKANPSLKKVFDVAKSLEGCVRHVSVHACAVIIGKDDLSKCCPIQWAPGAEELKITQFPYQQLEHLGLLKMDFLGLKNLSILEKAILNIELTTGEKIDLNEIPIDDTKTFEMMAVGETTGVFQFESAGMRRYLKELKPTEFEDLVAMNALYRPGPMEYIPTYIEGKHNPDKVKYMDDSLEPILRKTYGIAVYQEQVLRIAQDFAGFSLGEADLLRKAIGKKIASILAQQREKFISGAVDKGFSKKLATKIFDDIIVPFSGYGFNRSHAVCYARIAYETAYLRANYPVEFMAAMMTTDRNNTDRIVLEMNECASMDIEVLPPSINESGSYFTVIEGEDEAQLVIKDDKTKVKKIRFGLTAIKGLGEDTVDMIMAERKVNGKFQSLQDFAKRVPAKLMNKKTLEALGFSGALDEFGDRGAIVESLDDLAKFAKEHQEKSEAGQMGLFGGVDDSSIDFALKDTVAEKDDILRWERESLGLFVSDHPLRGLSGYFEKYGALIGKLTKENDVGEKRTIHGLVISVRKILTRRGKNMAILEVEDTSGKIECAVFPQVFDKVRSSAMEVDAFVRIRGKIDERNDTVNLIVDEVKIGNLKAVQQSTEMFVEEGNESKEKNIEKGGDKKGVKEGVLKVKIPSGTKKSTIDELKKVLV
ncbi:MAG: DNA polymerase III subunit alpha, partial [Candidatus Peregrinibacteria bacterium]|nr:DNA polymerase III subunit alpha [Candidatus Peregrinibacteria bacterium]